MHLTACTAAAALVLVAGAITLGQGTTGTLVTVWAHADDEAPVGPILARYAREGVQVHMIIATDIVTQLVRAGAPGVPQRLFYASIPAEGIRAMNPAREVPPFVIPQPSAFTMRVRFTDADLEAARRSMMCHKTQVADDAVARVISSMRNVWKGERLLSPMVPQEPGEDLFQ